MIKRNSAIALGSILAVTGCSGGGGHSVTPTTAPATKANKPQGTAHLTINASLLKHAKSSKRKPAFFDGIANGYPILLQINGFSDDNLAITTQVSISPGSTSVAVSVPLYGPGGFVEIKEIDSDSATLADSGNVRYDFDQGQASVSLAPITLNAVLGGFAVDDTPDGSDFPRPLSPFTGTACMQTFEGETLFLFPTDATGNFTSTAVAGGFPNPVTYVAGSGSASGASLVSTNVPGVFKIGGFGSITDVEFQSSDIFGNFQTGFMTFDSTGYICSNAVG